MGVPLITRSDRTFVYFVDAAGKILPAPDTRVTAEQLGLNPNLWKRCEATGSREIEKVSLRLSKQMFEEKKARHVGQKLREMAFLKDRALSAKLRAAQGYTAKDVEVNRNLEKKWIKKQDEALALIALEFDPSSRHTALDIELKEQSMSPLAGVFEKRQGIE